MYKVGNYSDELDRFNVYLKSYIINLEEKLVSSKKSSFYNELVNKILNANSGKDMLELMEDILKIDSSLKSRFDVIDFYAKNNALNAVQVENTIELIKNSGIIERINAIVVNNQDVKDIENELLKCREILGNNISDYDYYFKLIDESDLSESDKLVLLSKVAYESTIKKNKRNKRSSIEVLTPQISYASLEDIKQLDEKYEDLKSKLNVFRNKYVGLMDGKTKNQIGMYNSIVKGLGQEFVSYVSTFEIKEEVMNLLSIKYNSLINEFESFRKSFGDKVKMEDLQMYELYLEEFSELLTLYEVNDKKFEVVNQEMSDRDYTNIVFLTDEEDKPYFDVNKLNKNEKKVCSSLINKLENAQFEYKRHKNGTTVLGTRRFNIYVNIFGSYGSSYIILDNNHTLILAIEPISDIYSKSLYLERVLGDKIEELKTKVSEDYESVLDSQIDVRKNIIEGLGTTFEEEQGVSL